MRVHADVPKPSVTAERLSGHAENSSFKLLWQYFKMLSYHAGPSDSQQ